MSRGRRGRARDGHRGRDGRFFAVPEAGRSRTRRASRSASIDPARGGATRRGSTRPASPRASARLWPRPAGPSAHATSASASLAGRWPDVPPRSVAAVTAPAGGGTVTLRSMRTGALAGARFVLLAGPVALAFFTGGYFDEPRVWAGLVAWRSCGVILASADPLPRVAGPRSRSPGSRCSPSGRSSRSPGRRSPGPPTTPGSASSCTRARCLRRRRCCGTAALRAVEPALAAGALIVIGYGISERLLPGLLRFQRSASAEGRLEQPLTYWNAMGEAGRPRPRAVRPPRRRRHPAAALAPRRGRGGRPARHGPVPELLARRAVRRAPPGSWRSSWWRRTRAAARRADRRRGRSARGRRRGTAAGVTSLRRPWHARAAGRGCRSPCPDHGRGRRGAAGASAARGDRAMPLPRRAPLIALVVICALRAGARDRGRRANDRTAERGATRYTTCRATATPTGGSRSRLRRRAAARRRRRWLGGLLAALRDRSTSSPRTPTRCHSRRSPSSASSGRAAGGVPRRGRAGGGEPGAWRRRSPPDRSRASSSSRPTPPLDWDWEMPAVTLIAIVLAGSLLALAESGGGRAVRRRERP